MGCCFSEKERNIKAEDFTCTALYDFSADKSDELSFKKEDVLQIIEEKDENWLVARSRSNKTGLIPANYVLKNNQNSVEKTHGIQLEEKVEQVEDQLEDESEHKTMSRKEALDCLKDSEPGTYIIRYSEHVDGLVLSVKSYSNKMNACVFHYKILSVECEKLTLEDYKHKFDTLTDLTDFYRHSAEGITCKLDHSYFDKVDTFQFYPGLTETDEIDRKSIDIITTVGKGYYGEVFKAQVSPSNKLVAVKTVDLSRTTADEILKEAVIMKNLSHKHVLSLFGVCSRESPYYIITDYMEKGDLLTHLRKIGSQIMFPEIIKMGIEIISGMDYLENKGIIHRDLRAANILLDEYIRCKIADFGLSKFIDNEEKVNLKIPYRWSAPESIAKREFTSKSDVWSFGMLLVEMLTEGSVPFSGIKDVDVKRMIKNDEVHQQPKRCPDKLYELMKECWKFRPEDRPVFLGIGDYLIDKLLEVPEYQGF